MGKFTDAIKAAFCCTSNTTAPDPLSPRMARKSQAGTTRAGVSVELTEPDGPQFLGKRTYTESMSTTSFFSVKPPPIVIAPVDAFPERDTQPSISADEFAKELSIKVAMRPRSGTYEAKLPNRINALPNEIEDIELNVAN